MKNHSVLICTGSIISAGESSLFLALRKLFQQSRHQEAHWSATQIKAVTAELHLCSKLYWGSLDKSMKEYLSSSSQQMRPELTEVVIATLLQQAGVAWEAGQA